MKCPKCGKNMNKDFCMFCGYMLNGNYIHKTNYEVNDLAKVLGDDYDKVIRNENTSFIFFLGPLYFAYRNYFFLGIMLELINLTSYLIVMRIISAIFGPQFPLFLFYIFLFLYFILNKLFWMTLCNPIYIFLINRKIDIIKNKHDNNKDDYIRNIRIRNIYKPIFIIVLFILIPIITLYFYKMIKGTL